MENALLTLNSGEPGKAGELLWGSMAEALQAVAASRGIPLKNHRSLHWFVGALGKELNDRSIIEAFYEAEDLHSNFHEVELSTEDVALLVQPIREAVNKLFGLIPKELIEEPEQS